MSRSSVAFATWVRLALWFAFFDALVIGALFLYSRLEQVPPNTFTYSRFNVTTNIKSVGSVSGRVVVTSPSWLQAGDERIDRTNFKNGLPIVRFQIWLNSPRRLFLTQRLVAPAFAVESETAATERSVSRGASEADYGYYLHPLGPGSFTLVFLTSFSTRPNGKFWTDHPQDSDSTNLRIPADVDVRENSDPVSLAASWATILAVVEALILWGLDRLQKIRSEPESLTLIRETSLVVEDA